MFRAAFMFFITSYNYRMTNIQIAELVYHFFLKSPLLKYFSIRQ